MSVEGTDKGGIVRVEDLRVTESGTIRLREVSVSEVAEALRSEGYLVIGRDENEEWQLPQRDGMTWASDLSTIFDEVQDEFNCQIGVHDFFEIFDGETEVMCDNCGAIVPVLPLTESSKGVE